MQKIERLMAITLLLQARGKMTARRLAEILGTSTRTIYRDITSLSLSHVPISMDYGPGGGYYLPADYQFDSTVFTREEAVSLILSTDIAGNYSLFAGDDGLHRALIKLEATLPEEYRSEVREARERIFFDMTAWRFGSARTSYLEQIRSAVLQALKVDILYPCVSCVDTPGMRWRRLDPIGLVFKGLSLKHIRTGIWYLVAYCHTCRTYQTFRVGNIENIRVSEEVVCEHQNFDLRTYWKEERSLSEANQPPIGVILHISEEARHKLEGRYTILEAHPDESIIVEVKLNSVEVAVPYVLAFGIQAIVIEPDEVRIAVANAARQIAEQYYT
ncbi:helix-turn-helix transcriptional regulator [Ktedonospora formicarum]|uniref:DeoR family transcriptional regulator n=1 Tax=Ktedonospora formicarum TaxID=2778364 RepID=A0A8J3I333_9CHLR|nr:YafY family protein [Ktedonospora formicarum]GHO46696.1 DeoR family transcriptional regulator [Ktedonospora formicarum]